MPSAKRTTAIWAETMPGIEDAETNASASNLIRMQFSPQELLLDRQLVPSMHAKRSGGKLMEHALRVVSVRAILSIHEGERTSAIRERRLGWQHLLLGQ
jgi:hypothetical protein